MDPRFNLGMRAMQAGDWRTAIQQFDALSRAQPNLHEARFYLGIALLSAGRPADAVAPLQHLANTQGRNPAVLNALGSALAGSGRRAEAAQAFRKAMAAAPTMAEAAENLARVMLDDGMAQDALPVLNRLLEREPKRPSALLLLAQAQAALFDMDGAERGYRAVLAAQPGHLAALNGLGLLYFTTGRGDQALECFDEILRLRPGDAVAGNNRGMTLSALKRFDEAEAQYRAVLDSAPTLALTHLNLGRLLYRRSRPLESIEHLEKAGTIEARWWSALTLPLIYEDEDDRLSWRERYRSRLMALKEEFERLPPAELGALAAVLEKDTFYLPYQGENDRDLQRMLGGMKSAIAQAAYGARIAAQPGRREGRIKVGFLSAHLFDHTIANLFTKWMTGLDPAQFEVSVFHIGRDWAAETDFIKDRVDHFAHLDLPLPLLVERVSQAGLDVLIYPDVGMSWMGETLAALRLAPVQCAAVGHPETTGLPTIDYFLSGELIEPEDGDSHYTETLIRIPGIGFNFVRPPVEQARWPAREPDVPLFFCAQSPWKLLPRFDDLFARIAEEMGRCRILFVGREQYATPLRQRLDTVFARRGLRLEDFVSILAPMPRADFLGLTKAADVVLDSPEWSGGNTTMEALVMGAPMVTMAGRLMRGRVTAGIFARAGLAAELVAADGDEYVAKAVALARDKAQRERISRAMAEAAQDVFDAPEGIEGLSAFLKSVARR